MKRGHLHLLEGYASIKHQVDAYGDILETGAYQNINRWLEQGFVTVGHAYHKLPIGYILAAHEDEIGLKVQMAFHATQEGESALVMAQERLGAGKSVGLSIGYLPLKWRYESRDGSRVRVLEQIELKEFSLVNMPAAIGARATRIWQVTDPDQIEEEARKLGLPH